MSTTVTDDCEPITAEWLNSLPFSCVGAEYTMEIDGSEILVDTSRGGIRVIVIEHGYRHGAGEVAFKHVTSRGQLRQLIRLLDPQRAPR